METIKAIIIVKSNFHISCYAFVEKLAKSNAILKKINVSENMDAKNVVIIPIPNRYQYYLVLISHYYGCYW